MNSEVWKCSICRRKCNSIPDSGSEVVVSRRAPCAGFAANHAMHHANMIVCKQKTEMFRCFGSACFISAANCFDISETAGKNVFLGKCGADKQEERMIWYVCLWGPDLTLLCKPPLIQALPEGNIWTHCVFLGGVCLFFIHICTVFVHTVSLCWQGCNSNLHLHFVMRVSISMRDVSSWKGTWNLGSSLRERKADDFTVCSILFTVCRIPFTDIKCIQCSWRRSQTSDYDLLTTLNAVNLFYQTVFHSLQPHC